MENRWILEGGDDDEDDKEESDERNLGAGEYDMGTDGARIGEHEEDPSL